MAIARQAAGGGTSADRGVCLSMHQPWASLLVYGIKRIEGRGWHSEHRGRLWIAATAKQPTQEEIQEMEEFYRTVFALDGLPAPEFPPAYPTGVLLGCVDVADVVKAEQVEAWEALPAGLKAEVGSPVCFLCQAPQRLVVPQQMRGWPKLFDLEKKVHKVAQLGLRPAPNGRDFRWAAYGRAPPPEGLAPSQNRNKYQELQKKMDAARTAEQQQQQQQRGAAGRRAHEQEQEQEGGSSDGGGGGGKTARTVSCTSPRAAAAAATAAAAVAGLPRALALQQQQQQAAHGPPSHHHHHHQQQQQQQQQEADPAKRLRAVQKKLRQIALLEERAAAGQPLSPEELAKAQQRQTLEAEAAALAGAPGAS